MKPLPTKPLLVLACIASSVLASACTIREERTVQPAPSAAVVAPAPSAVVYTDTMPKTTTTTVYSR
jgi:hypothetical protein